MSLVSTPTYNTVFRYEGSLSSSEFNRTFSKTFPPGIYEGGNCSLVTTTQIEIDSLAIVIENSAGNDIAVRVHIPSSFKWNVETGDTDQCLFVARYTWEENNAYNVEFLQVEETLDTTKTIATQLWSTDLIITKFVFDGSELDSSHPFDYTRKSESFFANEISLFPSLKVRSSEDPTQNDKVYISSGIIKTPTGGIVNFTGGYSGALSDTTINGRIDYIYIDDEGSIAVQEGEASASPEPKPFYDRKVLALISRGSSRTDIKGSDIIDYRHAHNSERLSSSILVDQLPSGEYFTPDSDGFITIDMALRQLHSERVTNSSDISTINSTAVFKAGAQDITGIKRFTALPKIETVGGTTLIPTENYHPITKKYYENITTGTGAVRLGSSGSPINQTIYGTKTFNNSPIIPDLPAGNTSAINKNYLDGSSSGVVHDTGDETIEGVKTFNSLPKVPTTNPSDNAHTISKKYYDDNTVLLTGIQSIAGVKTFGSYPVLPSGSNPSGENEPVKKSQLDTTNTTASDHISSDITNSNTVHGIQQGSGNGFDADKVDGAEKSTSNALGTSDNLIPTQKAVKEFVENKSYMPKSGGTFTGNVTNRHIYASSNNAYDIGASGTRFRNAWFSGEVTSNTFNADSSRKKKKDIQNFEKSGLKLIDSLQIVNYKYKTDLYNQSHIGVIAEDSPKEILGRKGKSVSLSDSIGVLFKAVQELSEENKKLKEKLGID